MNSELNTKLKDLNKSYKTILAETNTDLLDIINLVAINLTSDFHDLFRACNYIHYIVKKYDSEIKNYSDLEADWNKMRTELIAISKQINDILKNEFEFGQDYSNKKRFNIL